MEIKKQKKSKWRAIKKMIFLLILFWVLTFVVIISSDLLSIVSSYIPKILFTPKYQVEQIDSDIEKLELPIVNLKDSSGNLIGKGVLLKENIFVAPDHLWDAGDKKLYYENLPITILVRDFAQDLLFFKLKQQDYQKVAKWNSHLPSKLKNYYWRTNLNVYSTQMINSNEVFESDNKIIKDLVSFDVNIEHGDSGTPVFDDQGKIYGIFISADLRENKSYMIKSETIQKLADEYLH